MGLRAIPGLATGVLIISACTPSGDAPEIPADWEGTVGPASEIGEGEHTICAQVQIGEALRTMEAPGSIDQAERVERKAWERAMDGGVLPEVHFLAAEYVAGSPDWLVEMITWCADNLWDEAPDAPQPPFPEGDHPFSTTSAGADVPLTPG